MSSNEPSPYSAGGSDRPDESAAGSQGSSAQGNSSQDSSAQSSSAQSSSPHSGPFAGGATAAGSQHGQPYGTQPPATTSYPPQGQQPTRPYEPYGGGYGAYGSGGNYQQAGSHDQPGWSGYQQSPYPAPQSPYPNQPLPSTYGEQAGSGYPGTGYGTSSAGGDRDGQGYPGAGYGSYSDGPHPDAATAPAGRGRRSLLVLALIAALIGGGIGGGIVALVNRSSGDSVDTRLKITNSTGAPAAQLDGTVGAAAAKIRPSVVTINVTGSQEAGTGSGVVIRDDGYILTNDHVVDIGSGAGDIQVLLSDGRTAAGKIVGRDTPDDLAVIKVDGLNNLTAATFAKSGSLSVGQSVVAVGAPLGLSDTVTSGIVSNTARPVRAGDNDQAVFEAVQTDAAINPGNSGGPLVDLNGSVVGINAAIASDNSGGGGLQIPGQQTQSGNIGIGFAIPSDEASRIASELIATGKATHAVLGVEVTSASSNAATIGVPLHTVTADGVASKAGLKVGDVVTKINDQQVTTADALIAAVRSHAPGEQVTLTYTRGSNSSTVKVTLGSSNG